MVNETQPKKRLLEAGGLGSLEAAFPEEEPVEEPVEEEQPERVSPLRTSREFFEIDQAFADWSTQYSRTGQLPGIPENQDLQPFYDQWLSQVKQFELENPPPEAPQAPDVDIFDVIETAKRFNVPTQNFVSTAQLAELALPFEQRSDRFDVPYEQYLTWEQAKFLGFDVQEGDVVRMTPRADGEPQFSLVQEPTQAPDEVILYQEYLRTGGNLSLDGWVRAGSPLRPSGEYEDTLKDIYPEMFDPNRSFGFSSDEIPSMVFDQLILRIDADYEAFAKDLYDRAGSDKADDILRLFGVTEENILKTLDFTQQEIRVKGMIREVFPDFQEIDQFVTFVDTDPMLFIETMQTGGKTLQKERLLQYMNYTPDQIQQIFSTYRADVEVDGVSQPLSIDMENQKAFDESGNFAGQYNPATKEFTKAPEKGIFENFFDTLAFSSRQYWENFEGFMLGVAFPSIFPDMPEGFMGDFGKELTKFNRQARDDYRWLYNENKSIHEEWLRQHPEMAPRVDFQEGAFQHPELLKDPEYWAYEITNIMPFLVSSIGILALTGGAGAPYIALNTMGMGAVEGGSLFDDLLNAGAPEDKARQMAAVGGGIMGLLESVGRLPILKQVSPFLFGQFKRKASSELVKRSFRETAKKFGKTFTLNEFAEVSTEVAQEVISNVAVGFFDENRSILDNLPDIAVKTAVATSLSAGFGAGASVRMIGRNEQAGLTDLAKKAKGWVQDEKGNWFERIKEAVREEGGFVRLPGGEEITPSRELLQSLIGATQAKSRESELLKTFSREQLDQAHDAGLVTRSPKGIYSITLKGRDFLKQEPAEAEREKLTLEPQLGEAIPKPAEGEDVGLQADIFGGLTETRIPGKGREVQISMEDQLRLEQAQQAAEVAPSAEKAAYEAQAQIEGLEVSLKADPVANKLIFIGKDKRGRDQFRHLDFFISLKEGTFPDYFTVKQAKMLFPDLTVDIFTQPGTPQFNRVPRDVALNQLTKEFGMSPDQIADRVVAIRQERRQLKEHQATIKANMTERPLPMVPERTNAEVTANWTAVGQPKLTLKQIDALTSVFTDYILDPTTLTAYQVQRQLRSAELTKRMENLHARAQELFVEEGVTAEEAQRRAIQELSGPLPALTTAYLAGIAGEMRDAHFAKVHHVFNKLGPEYALERAATITALTNALDGKPIPRKRGRPEPGSITSLLFPEGGSAWDRLNFVFGKQPKVLKAIDKMAKERKPLSDVVEGVVHEIGRKPIPVDQETADYLRSLSTWSMQETTGLEIPGEAGGVLTYDPTGKLGLEMTSEQQSLFVREIEKIEITDPRTAAEREFAKRKLELGTQLAEGQITKDVYDIELMSAFSKGFSGTAEGVFTYNPTGKLGFTLAGQQIMFGEQPYQDLIVEDLRSPRDLAWAKMEVELGKLFAEGTLDFDEYTLERAQARDTIYPLPPITHYEPPIDNAIEELDVNMWPPPVTDKVVKALKEIGMSPVDIGNFLRANKASFDFSFWRQQSPLIMRHPVTFAQANVSAWQAIWSQKSAEASWAKITQDPIYQLYEFAAENGGDFLRPLTLEKGTEQWRGTEEFGYIKGAERVIPKLTAWLPHVRISQRAFETGTNVHNWLIFKNYYNAMQRYSEDIASGKKQLKPFETFDMQKEMTDFARSLANFTARGSLGQFSAAASTLSGLFFAPRASIGRVLSVKDLVNSNARVRRHAWESAASFVGVFGGIIMVGAMAGWWDVERDPRSAEYMSIRIGKTRIDPWGGFRQFLVFFTRAVTLSGVSSVTGAEYKVDPLSLMQTFIRGKASPLASLILDFWRGKNFIGEKVEVGNKMQWAERVAPFAIWDIYEAYKEDPWIALQVAFPAVVGAGVQTYTGDWQDNFPKLGLPKYSDNLPDGITDPFYDAQDLWADTASQFAGVDPATLTESKGFPNYIRAIVEAKLIKESLDILPNERLVDIDNFAAHYSQWNRRKEIVASGDEEALKTFDQDERTKNAYKGNFSQTQFALLNQYHAITDEEEQKAFLEEHEADIGVNPRSAYLRSHPSENAQLAVWGQAKLLSRAAYDEFNNLVASLDIPTTALPASTLPPEASVDSYFEREKAIEDHGAMSAESLLVLAREPDLLKWYQDEARKAGTNVLDTPKQPVRYYELQVKNRAEREYMKTITDKDNPAYIDDLDERRTDFETEFPESEYFDDNKRIQAIANGFDDAQVEAWVERGRLVDDYSGGSPKVKEWAFDNPEAYQRALEEELLKDKGGLATPEERGHYEEWVEPAIRLQAKNVKEDSYWQELGDKANPDTYIEDDAERRKAFSERYPSSDYFNDLERIEAYKGGFTDKEADLWAERGRKVAKFEPSSAEAKIWLVDHKDVWDKALEAKMLTDDGSTWNIPALRITARWRHQDNEYDDIPSDTKEGRAARAAYLAGEGLEGDELARRIEYRLDRWRRDAYEMKNSETGATLPEVQVDNFVAYREMETKGKRQERFLIDNPGFAQAMHDVAGIDIPNAEEVPAVEYDDIYDAHREDFDKLDGLSDNESPHYIEDKKDREAARDDLRFEDGKYSEFGLSELRRNAYGKFVPEAHIQAYVGYYTIIGEGKPKNWKLDNGTDLWYEDDWFMMENIEFYRNVYRGVLGNEAKDFTKVPTRRVFNLYLNYLALPHLAAKDEYRSEEPELDAWLVDKFGFTPVAEKKRRFGLTTYERFLEDWAERGSKIEEKLKALRE